MHFHQIGVTIPRGTRLIQDRHIGTGEWSMEHLGVSFAALDAAVLGGSPDVVGVAHEVGASAAARGVPLHEVLDRVERAHAAAEVDPSFDVLRSVVEAWAERAALAHVDMSCENPVTSWAGVPHLRCRLSDVYRRAERDGVRGCDRYVLVVVELGTVPAGHELEASLRALDVAEALRLVFTGDETLAQLSPRRFAVLVERSRADALTVHTAAAVVRRDVPNDGGVPPRLWVEELPPDPDDMLRLLAVLVA